MGGVGDSEWGKKVGSVVLVELWTFGWVIGLPDPPPLGASWERRSFWDPPPSGASREVVLKRLTPLPALRWKGGPFGTPLLAHNGRRWSYVRPPLVGGPYPTFVGAYFP